MGIHIVGGVFDLPAGDRAAQCNAVGGFTQPGSPGLVKLSDLGVVGNYVGL